jgi:hypothetical protein
MHVPIFKNEKSNKLKYLKIKLRLNKNLSLRFGQNSVNT